MKLLFKQRFFSWLDSYDIYDEENHTLFTVKGELAWRHQLRVYDAFGNEAALLKEEIMHLLHPTFQIHLTGGASGCIRKELTLLRPRFTLDFCGWDVQGEVMEWDYTITDATGRAVATVTKELFHWTDTYVIDVKNPKDALGALMVTLAIDAEKCSRN